MVLKNSGFVIPANFVFQPFDAEWQHVRAELVEWVENPMVLRRIGIAQEKEPLKKWLRVRMDVPETPIHLMLGFPETRSYTIRMDRAIIPPDVLQPHENCRNTPDISCRWFSVLICRNPEFEDGIWNVKPGKATKNAWGMQNEFLNLSLHNEDDWSRSLLEFLDKWGLWEAERGFIQDRTTHPLDAPSDTKLDRPDFVLVMPHLVRKQQEEFRIGSLPKSRRHWLKTHKLNLQLPDEPPFFLVRQSYCKNAIEDTITIEHLAERKFGICKYCGNRFEHDTKHKRKTYCSRPCIKAGSQRNWRKNQKKEAKKKAQGRI